MYFSTNSSRFVDLTVSCETCPINSLGSGLRRIQAIDAANFLLGLDEDAYTSYVSDSDGRQDLADDQLLGEQQTEAAIDCAQMHKFSLCVVKLSEEIE